MYYLLLGLLLGLLFAISETRTWKNKILELKSKDDFCRKEAQWYQKKIQSIYSANEKLRALIKSCPALVVEPTKSALKSAQSTARLIELHQNFLLFEIHRRKIKNYALRVKETPRISLAKSSRLPPLNPCELPSEIKFHEINFDKLVIYREKEAGFDIHSKNASWQYANEEVTAL